jgi:hypothetical protein
MFISGSELLFRVLESGWKVYNSASEALSVIDLFKGYLFRFLLVSTIDTSSF